MADYRTVKATNICFDCERACGGCSWSSIDPVGGGVNFQLPEGCKAEPVRDMRNPDEIITYHIMECPLFVQTPSRPNTCSILNDDQNEKFLENPIDFIQNFIPRLKRKREMEG